MNSFLKDLLRKLLGPKHIIWARKNFASSASLFFSNNLPALAAIYGTDKEARHKYTQYYQEHFNKRRKARLNILEIGVGGYESSTTGGASLRMWKRYFPHSKIYGIDIFDKSPLQEDRIYIYQGSQDDEQFLRKVVASIGHIDIIIDDGSHINSHVIKSFEILFPLLNEGGIYVIEDLQTAYCPRFEGKLYSNEVGVTSIEFLKDRVDGLNYKHFLIPEYEPSYFDRYITSIHFYCNICFI